MPNFLYLVCFFLIDSALIMASPKKNDFIFEINKKSYKYKDLPNSLKQDIYVVLDSKINFTSRLGVLVHCIIGYNIFKDFVVEINYRSKYIRSL